MSSTTATNKSGSGAVILPSEVVPVVAAACTRAWLLAKSGTALEDVKTARLGPDAKALLESLISADGPRESVTTIREIGKGSDGLAFVKKEDGIVQRIKGDAQDVLKSIVRSTPGIGAHYADTVPHVVQIMCTNTALLRAVEENPAVEAAAPRLKRIRKK